MRLLTSLIVTLLFVCACGDNNEVTPDAPKPACFDGLDNDNDGKVDFPDDPGCESLEDQTEDSIPSPACSDKRDNDGDGKADYPNDPGCILPQSDTETDDCPDGPGCPECGDGQDNDGNGKRDYPADPGCESAADAVELVDDPDACGTAMEIKQLPASGMDTGTLAPPSISFITSPCGGGGGAPAVAYVFHVSEPRVVVATTDLGATAIDTVLDLRSTNCDDPSAHLACHDDISTTNKKSRLVRAIQPGTYYLIVEGNTTADTGMYGISVQLLPGQGTACVMDSDCGPGLVCRIPAGQTVKVCSPPVCSDGTDDDGDGKIDYPSDPGCTSETDSTENDVCATSPTDPACPACANGIDDDNDGDTDYPNDPTCISASTVTESCAETEEVIIATTPIVTGTTVGAVNDYQPPPGNYNGHLCSTTGTHTAPDRIVQLDVPALTSLSLRLNPVGYDSAHILLNASCGGTPIECYDNPANMVLGATAAGRYYLVIDGYSTASGTFTLNIAGSIVNGESCESPLAQSGALTCGTGYSCKGAVGSRTCQPAECNDMMDNNGDGKTDYPNDPGCSSPVDDTETTVCPGPACPACANGIDDDNDGDTDYPNDPACLSASATSEACAQSEEVIVATMPIVTGTTVGAVNDYQPPPGNYNGHLCSTTATHTAPDRVVQLDVPTLTSLSLRLNPVGYDSAHILLNASCGGMPVECYDNPANMVLGNTAAGRYYLVIDGYSTASGTFTLNIAGSIANGASCESPLAQSGALTCGTGHSCKGAVGSRTCSPAECNDTMDNNGDGKTDYPNDPGCSSPTDDTETTVCPGPACPACSDGVDNDGDMLIDYPLDTGCLSAAGSNEGCAESDPIAAITTPTTTGTLVGAVDDHNPSCVTTNLADKIFTLDIPTALQSLTIDTENSVVDTVLSLMTSTCAEPSIICDDDGGVGVGDSLITRAFVPAGSYTLAVDADATPLGTFEIHVQGTILPGGSCEGTLFQNGVLSCPPSFGCNGAPGQRKCTAAQCADGVDNNLDGVADYPNDPGCTSPSDNTETTVCPGPACPQCGDGVDNDGDGDIDYPDDDGCHAASGNAEGCIDSDPIAPITTPTTMGSLVGATNDHQPFCVTATTIGVDLMFSLNIPALQSLTIDTEGAVVDTVLSFMNSACEEPALACDDDGGVGTGDSLITRAFVPAGLYTIAVDARSTTPNTFILNVAGVISPGGSCESPLYASGVLECSTGFACTGAPGSRTCAVAQCLDGLDNNGDGLIDFPEDPGCVDFSDDTESDVCPGATCPVCADGIDNDNDGFIDYPDDPSCFAASGTNEACTQSEPIGAITQPVTTGNTLNLSNDYQPTCGSIATHAAPDAALRIDLSNMLSLSLNLTGFDSVHTLLNSTCGGTPVACSDPALMALTNIAAGTYYLIVDGSSTGNGPWNLVTSGVVAPGGTCEVPLFQSGAFKCTFGYACGGTPGARTCQPTQCTDGIDNNGDGLTDYPFDPACSSLTDNTEDMVTCPGASCPVCSNTMDDDTDGQADYPADTGCGGAGSTTEVFCAIETQPFGTITAPVTTGTLATPATDNYEQSCQTNTGNDRAFLLSLPVPVTSLQLDTLGSTVSDTVLSIWEASCGVEIECDDDDAPGTDLRSVIALGRLPAGNYAIQVDSFSTTNNGAFTLNVKGRVAAGTACTSPLFTTGVLACPTGTMCTAGTCQ